MRLSYAIEYVADDTGRIYSFNLHRYKNFVLDLKSKGYRFHETGHKSQDEAILAGNTRIGTQLIDNKAQAQTQTPSLPQ